MALMIPSPIPPDATPGERRVYEALSALPDDLTICHRRLFPGRRHVEEPDFVVLGAETGLIVLEVKDWKRGRPPEGLGKENPLEQAKRYVHGLQDLVRTRGFPVLVEAEGSHQKDLVFPCVPAVVFPYLTRDRWEEEGADLDIRHVLFREDLTPEFLLKRLSGLARLYFPPRLTAAQVDFLRGLVAPEFCLEPVSAAAPPRQLDPEQMQLVTTDLFLPPPEQRLARDLSVRLVRGVAGSGKTLLLLMRAKLLHQLQPSWRILVLTYGRDLDRFLLDCFERLAGDPSAVQITHFHKWCRDLLVEAGEWKDPLKKGERLALVAEALVGVEKAWGLGAEVAAEEIEWIKE
ncbi:MAG: NERD domain-containing protein [candidate division NC10 bacterium]|nr:NERD domain-containing protein [candidate division NC10 bacterium]